MSSVERPSIMEESFLPRSGGNKAVTIAEPESISPTFRPTSIGEKDSVNNPYPQSPKQHRANVARRLSGRPSVNASTSSLASQDSTVSSYRGDQGTFDDVSGASHHTVSGDVGREVPSRLVSQILDWLHGEKAKRTRKDRLKGSTHDGSRRNRSSVQVDSVDDAVEPTQTPSERSDGGLALDRLEQILADNNVLDRDMLRTPTKERKGSYFPRRHSSARKLRRGSTAVSSDTEYKDGDALVPSAEVVLDNSKTMSYSGGGADSDTDLAGSSQKAVKEKEAWLVFKKEIVRLAHTLRLKGWRKVPLDRGGDIDVERLSGALTNAVYVVSPPQDLPHTPSEKHGSTTSLVPKKPPPQLLLRIYGPQVEHLIDRESELQILRRLARKKIGPRLLGTFINGRFEEFFHARTLTAHDLRIPETSKQIAKRMRELHDGIELLEEERDAGPFVWRNWDKWVARCEEVITWVDRQMLSDSGGSGRSRGDDWKNQGLICGVEWSVFRKTVDQYREWLNEQYGGTAGLRQQLVFAHNDTQYGNLLRLNPSGESPLLLPANEHKQLVVIDFEYASANVPGLEFANHFTEWCYNYHNSEKAYACNTSNYPTSEEQHRFLKAYVQHRPQFHSRASATPGVAPSPGPSSSISSFMLDSRNPPAQMLEEESRIEKAAESEIRRLMHEARLWRVANSAQWVAWGIVQAKVDGMDEALEKDKTDTDTATHTPASDDAEKTPNQQSPDRSTAADSSSTTPYPGSDPLTSEMANLALDARDRRPEGLNAETLSEDKNPSSAEQQHQDNDEEAEEEFDYLSYAQERAMFFWGDVLSLGIVRKEDLPAELLGKVKIVGY